MLRSQRSQRPEVARPGPPGSRITQAEAELAQAGRTATHEPPEAIPRKRNREEGGKRGLSGEGGGVGKATQPAEMGTSLKGPELCCNSTVRPKSILSPGRSRHFPLSGVSVPPACWSPLLLFAE